LAASKISGDGAVADSLYLNLWFPQFSTAELLARTACVLLHLPYSAQRPGITYVSLHPVSWSEATILERRFDPGIPAEEALAVVSDLLHDDYAYLFEAFWDLWLRDETTEDWRLMPQRVRVIAHGLDFEDGAHEENGHLQVDFGLDSAFLLEDVRLTPLNEGRIRSNIQKLVEFSARLEQNCGVTGRLLWSESDENLAQKLVSRLQRVQ
jgi:hypothetical protein